MLLNTDIFIYEPLDNGMYLQQTRCWNIQAHDLHILDEDLLNSKLADQQGKGTHIFIIKSFIIYQLHQKIELVKSVSYAN